MAGTGSSQDSRTERRFRARGAMVDPLTEICTQLHPNITIAATTRAVYLSLTWWHTQRFVK